MDTEIEREFQNQDLEKQKKTGYEQLRENKGLD